jgi:hypothetical protein
MEQWRKRVGPKSEILRDTRFKERWLSGIDVSQDYRQWGDRNGESLGYGIRALIWKGWFL